MWRRTSKTCPRRWLKSSEESSTDLGLVIAHYNHTEGKLGTSGHVYPLRMWEAYGIIADGHKTRRDIEKARREAKRDL